MGSFVKEFNQVLIYKLLEKNEYYICPMKRYGSRGDVGEKDDKKLHLDLNVSDDELSETIIKAFLCCK
ncbi:hypothetical protein D3C86_2158480 [compost metagenome]